MPPFGGIWRVLGRHGMRIHLPSPCEKAREFDFTYAHLSFSQAHCANFSAGSSTNR